MDGIIKGFFLFDKVSKRRSDVILNWKGIIVIFKIIK